ncbi:GNAT family N-acetyltransferase [Oerskovia turbata]|uniref:GNAT family N-acetyltransferase n=1 Tax=Oerskovia turbata TaxID=1713 RepID=A0A4Q1KPJ3_9CELL|nr:GNAT family N-acetyltransferase [Oerskovia turbata]RXR23171.1 GNAT family N-acetyltransferase [Oerskovia turbata]RXR31911.1 GNAT family N-acetyltransferase [Oerskovia turbata]
MNGHDVPADPDPAPQPDQYPVEWEADVVLRDGTTTHVRPIRPSDAAALQRFHMGQSERSTYLRFFANIERLSDRDLERFTVVDHSERVALVAVKRVGEGLREDIIGVARFDKVAPHEAEVAFNIADAEQGRGLGSVLLEHLAAAARERGVRRFSAEVLPQNGKMLAVFQEAGYVVSQHVDDGIVAVSVDLDPTDRSREVMADREHRAEARSMHGLLTARRVLLVGPGPTAAPGTAERLLAERVLAGALRDPGDGTFEVVGLAAPGGPGLTAPPEELVEEPDDGDAAPPVRFRDRIADVPGPVDLALLALPPREAIAATAELERLGARAVVVLSAGFAETGPAGLALQRDLLRTAHTAGMRVVGPATYGLLTTHAGHRLNASLAEVEPVAGSIGIFCQSAPTAVTLLATALRRGIGISSFVSAGHRADVSGNDLMQFWQDDPETSVVCLYLESIGNPRKFSRIARRLASVKPVVVVTAGRSGQVVPPGHAVRSTRAPRRTLDEMLRQSGVIHAENTHHLVDIAQLLAHQPLPPGRRIGILTSSAALTALVAEAVVSAGLVVSDCSTFLPEDADDERIESAVAALYAPDACDVVVAVHVPTVRPRVGTVSRAVARAAAASGRTTVASVLGLHGLAAELSAPNPADPDGPRLHVPAYSTPEDAVAAVGAVVGYARWRDADHGTVARPEGVDSDRARAIVEGALAGDSVVDLDAQTTAGLLAAYGIELWPSRRVRTADEAVAAAHQIGWPVALKSTAESLRHRADLGGVRLDIGDEDELRADVAQMRASLAAVLPAESPRRATPGAPDTAGPDPADDRPSGPAPFEVQRMADAGVACVVRSTEDQLFGPVVSFGLAGDAVDLLGDVSYGVPPLTDVDVATMVRSIRAAPRLFGYMGAPVADTAALEDLLARMSLMADEVPELRSVELYPVVVAEHGAAVLGARVQVAGAQRADTLRRALPG